ncbi:unnamed protein product [Lampetra fluviatilis]
MRSSPQRRHHRHQHHRHRQQRYHQWMPALTTTARAPSPYEVPTVGLAGGSAELETNNGQGRLLGRPRTLVERRPWWNSKPDGTLPSSGTSIPRGTGRRHRHPQPAADLNTGDTGPGAAVGAGRTRPENNADRRGCSVGGGGVRVWCSAGSWTPDTGGPVATAKSGPRARVPPPPPPDGRVKGAGRPGPREKRPPLPGRTAAPWIPRELRQDSAGGRHQRRKFTLLLPPTSPEATERLPLAPEASFQPGWRPGKPFPRAAFIPLAAAPWLMRRLRTTRHRLPSTGDPGKYSA